MNQPTDESINETSAFLPFSGEGLESILPRIPDSAASLGLKDSQIDLLGLIQNTVDEIREIYPGRSLFKRQSEKESLWGFWCPDSLRRALESLIFNGIKYGDPETAVSVVVERLGNKIRLMVHNFGEPIPAAEIHRLFHWLGRTQLAIMSGTTGCSFDLMLVKGICERHNGSVSVESTSTKGTLFTIELPIDARTKFVSH